MIEKFKRALDWERKDTEEMLWVVTFGAIVVLGVLLS